MRIIPYEDDTPLEDINSMAIYIKAVPFEGSFVPAMTLVSPDEDYITSIDELNCLMDGVEIASNQIDNLITSALKSHGYTELNVSDLDFSNEEEDEEE
jgi:hypothetical protein